MVPARAHVVRGALGAAVLVALVAHVPAHAQWQVAQYVADPAHAPGYAGALAYPYESLSDPGVSRLAGDRRGPAPLLDPLGLSGYSIGAEFGKPRAGGESVPWGGALDYEFRQGVRAADPDSRSHVLRVGPRVSFLPDVTTHLYYRYRYDAYGAPSAGGMEGADQVGAGVAQTVPIGDRSALFRVEYGVETPRMAGGVPAPAAREALNLSGAVPLPWGMTASFEADYGFESSSVASWRNAFRAGLSGWLADNLRANISLSYAEDDEGAEAQARRRALGLNLHYAY